MLRLPDLDQAKSAVLNSLSSIDAQRGYRHAIEEFVEWYCSEPRLSFSKTVVLRYRIPLESRHLAPGTINLRLGAVRRLAYEASDCGLLSPDLAAGIRRVNGVKKIGVRLGNWLTPEQSERLWNTPDCQLLKGKRDRALLAVLLACGLRRRLDFSHVQQREDHWAIVDLKGKAGHTRTVPMPGWVKVFLDEWLQAANVSAGKLFRRVNRNGKAWGDGITEKAGWHVVREYARKAGIERLAPHYDAYAACGIVAGRVPGSAILRVANWSRFSFFSGMSPFKRPSVIWAASSAFVPPSMIASGSNRRAESWALLPAADHPPGADP